MAKALNVAKFLIFLKEHDPRRLELSNEKLQKLLYYCQGYNLAINDEALFNDPIEAGKYGPIVPNVYSHYKMFGDLDINDSTVIAYETLGLTEKELSIIAYVWKRFGELRDGTLLDRTHSETPWLNSWFGDNKDKTITQDTLSNYFKRNTPERMLVSQ
ncbi:type II toxin-antitoxin system antitoxin SocA domain-containing protein [Priestia megaterium]